MPNKISFMSANYVARQLNYHMTGGWLQGDRATQDYFKPVETFAARFEEILRDVQAMRFSALDLWLGHLHSGWATAEHIALARDLLARYQLAVPSLAGGPGNSRAEFEATCQLAQALGVQMLGGPTPLATQDRTFVVATLDKYDLRLAIENHPEKTPADMLAQIGDGGGGRIGTTVDTGWYGVQGYDVVRAIQELAPHIFHVHLKDVLAPGEHVTCRYGRGCVPIEACVRALQEINYSGYYSSEHEPEGYDPTEDCRANLAMLNEWLES